MPVFEPDAQAVASIGQHFWEILTLVRATALATHDRGGRNRLRDHQHIAQIEPFEASHFECRDLAARPFPKRCGEIGDCREGTP